MSRKNVLRVTAVVALALVLGGCGFFSRLIAVATDYSRICVAGVSYLQFASGASVEYTRDGKVKTCD